MRYKINNCLSWQQLDTFIYVFDERSKEESLFQNASALIWQMIYEGLRKEEIFKQMCQTFDVAHDILRTDLEEFVEDLLQRGFISEEDMDKWQTN